MSAKDDLETAKETIEGTYSDLDRDTKNVAENAVMLLDAIVRELDIQAEEAAEAEESGDA